MGEGANIHDASAHIADRNYQIKLIIWSEQKITYKAKGPDNKIHNQCP